MPALSFFMSANSAALPSPWSAALPRGLGATLGLLGGFGGSFPWTSEVSCERLEHHAPPPPVHPRPAPRRHAAGGGRPRACRPAAPRPPGAHRPPEKPAPPHSHAGGPPLRLLPRPLASL